MRNDTFSDDSGVYAHRAFSKLDALFLFLIVISIGAVIYGRSRTQPADVPAAFSQSVSLKDAMVQSQDSGKPVLVFATADWCGPCQSFKRGALSDNDVTRVIREETIPVYLDIDEHPEQAGMFGIRSIPTLIILDEGQEIARSGQRGESSLIEWIENAAETAISSGD